MKSVADKLQCVLNAAACTVAGTRKFVRGLSQLLHSDLHWVNVSGRVLYQLALDSPPRPTAKGTGSA